MYFKNTKRLIFDAVIEQLIDNKIIKCDNEFVCDYNFEILKDDAYKKIEKIIIDQLDSAKFNFIWFSDIDFSGCDKKHVDDVATCLLSENAIIRVVENLYTLPKYMDEAKKIIIEVLKKNKRITIVEVRDLLDTTRKTAKPILEYMDSLGITKKTGGESEREIGVLEADG